MTDAVIEKVARAIFDAGGYPVDAVSFEDHKLRDDFMRCGQAALAALEPGDSLGNDLRAMEAEWITAACREARQEAAEAVREACANLLKAEAEKYREYAPAVYAALHRNAAAIRKLKLPA